MFSINYFSLSGSINVADITIFYNFSLKRGVLRLAKNLFKSDATKLGSLTYLRLSN